MNRYSLIFALLVASSFAVHPTQAGDSASSAGAGKASSSTHAKNARSGQVSSPGAANTALGPLSHEAVELIEEFIGKAGKGSDPARNLQILFATVPHPVETHLAAAFDHNVAALQDGLQEAGYLFDNAWIPWDAPKERDGFADDEKEKEDQEEEDKTPGVLLFRGNQPGADPYANGIIVFLVSEKPTEGIAVPQAQAAVKILQQMKIEGSQKTYDKNNPAKIRILGPSYSGSFPSLVPMVELLSAAYPRIEIQIRSGGVSGGGAAKAAIQEIATKLAPVQIHYGSAQHDYSDSDQLAESTLDGMGIQPEQIAFLSEDESSFGRYTQDLLEQSKHKGWRISFPRDISSLRAGYAQQGIFDASSPTQPWKRFLNLKSEEQNEGDSVRSFGGTETTETQEAILFGISEFLKSHSIRAAVISATNEEDRLFLTQFLHVNNSGVRVVVIGTTRVFMRGSTAQFRGDLMVDDFPMLPRLHDWTGADGDHVARIFADGGSEGIFFAALDLFGQPLPGYPDHNKPCDGKYKWYPEYSEPNWGKSGTCVQQPPMYVSALGSSATWPVSETETETEPLMKLADSPGSSVEFPFSLFGQDSIHASGRAPISPPLHLGRYWKILSLCVACVIALYCAGIWYANPICRDHFASFQPSGAWDFWLLKVTIPALVASSAFLVLAWAAAIPKAASGSLIGWWIAFAAIALAPASIIGSALIKAAWKNIPIGWNGRTGIFILVAFLSVIALGLSGFFVTGPFGGMDIGAILNTYREMHWESGLSLVPTLLLFLAAFGTWASQAGNGAATLRAAPPLPNWADNVRISQDQARQIYDTGRPLPNLFKLKWLWLAWAVPSAFLAAGHFWFGPFKEITTLEPIGTTTLVRAAAAILWAIILFDVLQFLWLWDQLRVLLRALDNRTEFKRSFVNIQEFDWRTLWSFSGVSFRSMRAIHALIIDSLMDLSLIPGFTEMSGWARAIDDMRRKYNTVDLGQVSRKEYLEDARLLSIVLSYAGDWLAAWIANPKNAEVPVQIDPGTEAIQRAIESNATRSRFADEEEEVARLSPARWTMERFLCLMYIGFIQIVVARLHTLLVSVATMFSLLALGIALYPFVPIMPMLICGVVLLLLIAWAFFKVFSQMDTDPILSRIVNGDDRKLQGNFYAKFAEAMALPLLTAGSALLPGGAGRLLELVQALFSHGS